MTNRLHTNRRRGLLGLTLALLLPAAALTSCSSESSTRVGASETDAPATTAPQVTVPATIPEGTTLRVGDQLSYLQTVLEIGGQDQDFPYKVEYATFIGGPPMLQAFDAGALDTGFIGSTPLIFAQAAGQNLVAIAGWQAQRSLYGLVTTDASINGWTDLRGKRVAYQRGTAAEAVLLQALDKVGIDPADITTVDVPLTQVNSTLEGGSADAAISTEPLISLFLNGTPSGRVVGDAEEITDRSNFLLAAPKALEDPAVTAALADYAGRLAKAFATLAKEPGKLANAVFVDQYGLSPERAAELIEAGAGATTFFALPGPVAAQQQKLADLFLAADQIPAQLDVTAEFDGRFNDLILQAQEEAGR